MIHPKRVPAKPKAKFQITVPKVVYKINFGMFIFAIPAGIEIKLRIIGTILPKRQHHIHVFETNY